jgi:hypothetical protein
MGFRSFDNGLVQSTFEDVTGNGRIDFADIVWLFSHL